MTTAATAPEGASGGALTGDAITLPNATGRITLDLMSLLESFGEITEEEEK